MKRSFYLLLIMVVAAIAACTKPTNDFEDERLNPASTTYTYTITASNGDLATKSNYDAEGHFKWSAGDAISVLFHNNNAEQKNKFFTLTLVSGANSNSATFSGEIDNGYTIGASDGTESDKKIWALFPASVNHTYTEGSNPSFYVQPSVDFTTTHFSANIPMYALNAAEGALNFANLTCAYKFTVQGIKNGVNKIQCIISNASGLRDLSGSSEINQDSNDYYINFGWTRNSLSLVCNVTNNQATFYVPCRYFAEFKPTITIQNYSTGVTIKTFAASKTQTPTSMKIVKPIKLDVSDGDYFTPAIAINGDMTDWDPTSNPDLTDGTNYLSVIGGSHYKEFKVAYDSRYIYFYSKRDYNEALWTDGYYYFYFDWNGDGSDELVYYLRPFTVGSVGAFNASMSSNITENTKGISSFTAFCAGSYDANNIETEISILRSDLGIATNDEILFGSSGNKSASKVKMTEVLKF